MPMRMESLLGRSMSKNPRNAALPKMMQASLNAWWFECQELGGREVGPEGSCSSNHGCLTGTPDPREGTGQGSGVAAGCRGGTQPPN